MAVDRDNVRIEVNPARISKARVAPVPLLILLAAALLHLAIL